MKDLFLKIKGTGVISDSWLVNNKGEVVGSQMQGSLNKKMVSEISLKVVQLFALQSSYIGNEPKYIYMTSDDITVFSFDLDSLVLVSISKNTIEPIKILQELQELVNEFSATTKLIAKYAKKNISKRDMIAKNKMDEKSQGLLEELRRSNI